MQKRCEETMSCRGVFSPPPRAQNSRPNAQHSPCHDSLDDLELSPHSSAGTDDPSPKRPCRGDASRSGLPSDRGNPGVRDTGSRLFGHPNVPRRQAGTIEVPRPRAFHSSGLPASIAPLLILCTSRQLAVIRSRRMAHRNRPASSPGPGPIASPPLYTSPCNDSPPPMRP